MKNKTFFLISALILSFFGGYLDAYSQLFRGGKFAFMQTGNIITIASDIAFKRHNLTLLSSILLTCFILGLILAYFIDKYLKRKNLSKYLHLTLLIIIFILIIPNYFFPITDSSNFENSWCGAMFLGVIGGIMAQSFRSYQINFTPTMMTNNTKLMVNSFLDGIIEKKKFNLINSLIYLFIIICFILGVCCYSLLFIYNITNYITLIIAQFLILILIIIDISFLEKVQS